MHGTVVSPAVERRGMAYNGKCILISFKIHWISVDWIHIKSRVIIFIGWIIDNLMSSVPNEMTLDWDWNVTGPN